MILARLSLVILMCLPAACVRLPADIEPVTDFEVDRYLGTWYEIARLDHSFERGLSHVTAQYSKREDGGIRVLNRGYSEEDQEWSEAEGKAYFVGSEDIAHLKVSFFGPFYSTYAVFELQDDYEYAWVSGNNTSYLWLLARAPQVDPEVIEAFITRADELGFDTEELIFVEHD